MPYDTLTCTSHVNKLTVWPEASRSLFLDIQVETLLLGEFSLLARANLCYPSSRLLYVSTIFLAHLYVYTYILIFTDATLEQILIITSTKEVIFS